MDITPPDYETRMAILRKKEEDGNFELDNEILHYIASNLKTSIRKLEGALTRIRAFSLLHGNGQITLETAKELLKDMIDPEAGENATPENVIKIVAEYYNLDPKDITSQKRTKEIVRARHICMYLIRVLNDISLQDVGNILGKRDHSTVIHGYEKILLEMEKDADLKAAVASLKKKITGE